MIELKRFLLGIVCLASLPAVALDFGQRAELCNALPEGKRCVEVGKSVWSDVPSGSVSKNDKAITILLRNGERRIWENRSDPERESDNATFSLVGFLPESQYFLIGGSHYEWNTYEFVSYGSGSTLQIGELPFVSPDGKQFVSVNLPYGGHAIGVNVYKIDRQSIEKLQEVELPSQCVGCGSDAIPLEKRAELYKWQSANVRPVWVNNSEIALIDIAWKETDKKMKIVSKSVLGYLVKKENKWRLVTDAKQ